MYPKFMAVHALIPFHDNNGNTDRDGLPKTSFLGWALRQRSSSQSLNRRARNYDGKGSLSNHDLEMAVPSRYGFDAFVRQPLEANNVDHKTAMIITEAISDVATGKPMGGKQRNREREALETRQAKVRQKEQKEKALQECLAKVAEPDGLEAKEVTKARRQAERLPGQIEAINAELLAMDEPLEFFKLPEKVSLTESVEYAAFCQVALEAAQSCNPGDSKTAIRQVVQKAWKAFVRRLPGDDHFRKLKFGHGIDSMLHGRIGLGDLSPQLRGALYMSHATSVHQARIYPDHFSAVDELQAEFEPTNRGAAILNTAYLSSSLMYYFWILDMSHLRPSLLGLVDGDEKRATDILLAEVYREVHLAASPPLGGRANSTAPFTKALWIMVEMGDEQPCSGVHAFSNPVSFEPCLVENTYKAFTNWFLDLDANHQLDLKRAMMAMGPTEHLEIPVPRFNVEQLAQWAQATAVGKTFSIPKGKQKAVPVKKGNGKARVQA